jgi:signal transduction histidine kinase
MFISFLFLGVILCTVSLLVVVLGVLWHKHNVLVQQISAHKIDLDRTSKILIEKNLELVDQTILQQKMLETKDDFINIVSHQLRTPITEVKWNVDAVLHDSHWKLTPLQRKSMELLYSSIEHSIRLINNLVRLVSVEQGAVHLATLAYSPDSVIQKAAESVAKEFTGKNIQLLVNATCVGCSINSIDPDSLQMIVGNLVENAFYYTPEGGKVEVHTSLFNGTCKVVVADNGIGMSPEEQQGVFMKFRRGEEAVRTNARGSGLGLYIVKKIIEQHQGTITFVSKQGVGTTFTLTLPEVTQKQ